MHVTGSITQAGTVYELIVALSDTTPTVGETVGCNVAGVIGTRHYQWRRDGSNISGATSSTYTPVSADIGTRLSCYVTVGGLSATASATSDTVSAIPPPSINSISDKTYNQGDTVVIQARVTGGVLPYSWSFSLDPLNWSIGEFNGRITGSISSSQSLGDYTVRIRVRDANGDTDTETFDVEIEQADLSPSIGVIDGVTVEQGDSVNIQAVRTSGDPPFSWDFIPGGNPLGLSVSSSGRITGTIASSQATGLYSSTVRVTDDDGDTGTRSFAIVVESSGPPPLPSNYRRYAAHGTNTTFTRAEILDWTVLNKLPLVHFLLGLEQILPTDA